MADRTAQFETFVAPARARPSLWRLAAGAALAAVCWLAATAAALAPLGRLDGPATSSIAPLAFLATFAALIVGIGLAARLLHDRPLRSVVGPGGLRARDAARGAGIVILVAAVTLALLFAVAPPVRQADPLAWARWLPLALPAIAVQAAAEELAFRGYLMQGLAARFRSRVVWWGVPALLFGLLHWNPAEFGPNAWLVVLAATVAGLALADVTARTGNLSAAIGLHFANNAVALLVVALPSPLAGLALFLYPVDPSDPASIRPFLLLDVAIVLAAWAAWLAFRQGRR